MSHSAPPATRDDRTDPARILPLFRRALLDHWRSTLAWAVGLAAAILVYLPLFPSLGNSDEMQDMINALPPEMTRALNYDQIASGPGYTQATIFGLIGFLLLTIASVSWGASAVAGDEESGQLELTLAHAVTRPQVVLERALAIAVRTVALAAVVFILVLLLNEPAELGIQTQDLFGATVLFGGTRAPQWDGRPVCRGGERQEALWPCGRRRGCGAELRLQRRRTPKPRPSVAAEPLALPLGVWKLAGGQWGGLGCCRLAMGYLGGARRTQRGRLATTGCRDLGGKGLVQPVKSRCRMRYAARTAPPTATRPITTIGTGSKASTGMAGE